MIEVTSHITLNENEIEEHFIRATGPGGQKVNKTETAVQIRFDARKCRTIPPDVYVRLKALAGRRMTAAGVIILTARRFAAQERNRADARERLVELIRRAAVQPKHRRATKPSRSARKKRVETKKKRGDVKKTRGRVRGED